MSDFMLKPFMKVRTAGGHIGIIVEHSDSPNTLVIAYIGGQWDFIDDNGAARIVEVYSTHTAYLLRNDLTDCIKIWPTENRLKKRLLKI